MTVKSTITKRTKVEKKLLKQLKNPLKEKQNWRGRERESIDFFFFFLVNNLEGIGESGGNEEI